MNRIAKEALFCLKKALIVEDHAALALLLARALAAGGLEAEVIGHSAEAIVRLKDGSGNYEFACSVAARSSRGGWVLLEWVRTRHPCWSKGLVCGAEDEDFFLHGVGWRGPMAAFRKPFSFIQVQQTLAEILPYL